MIYWFLSLSIFYSSFFIVSSDLNFKAWQPSNGYPIPSDFPELQDSSLTSRPNTAIAFTGGGSRSFLASIGSIAGLNELGNNLLFKFSFHFFSLFSFSFF